MSKPARTIAVLDIETDPFKRGRVPLPFLWGFYDGERFRHWETPGPLFAYLADKRHVVYAHNGGRFDFHYILPWLETYREIKIINGRLAQFTIGECEFRDSWLILPEKLEKFVFDDTRKQKIDYELFEPENRAANLPRITEYLRADCITLYRAVTAFVEQYGRGLTLAGSAMKQWQAIADREKPRADPVFHQIIKPHYFGGRVECFRKGIIEKRFSVRDINSAYPFAMMHAHPWSTSKTTRHNVPLREPIIDQSMYEVAGTSAGAFPYRKEGEDGLSFPSDNVRRSYCITGWELRAALDTKTAKIDRIVQRHDFARTIDFKQYIEHFYAIKRASKKGSFEYISAKLFMNSLYGRFAIDPSRHTSCVLIPPGKVRDYEHTQKKIGRHMPCGMRPRKNKNEPEVAAAWSWAGMLGPHAVLACPPTRQEYLNIATAASITGFVRAYLWRHICRLRELGGEPLYCDTDSLAFLGRDPCRLTGDLGDWSDEGEGKHFNFAAIAGKKLYAFRRSDGEWKTASKGVRLTADEIVEVARGKTVTHARAVPVYTAKAKIKKADMPEDMATIRAPGPVFGERRVRMT